MLHLHLFPVQVKTRLAELKASHPNKFPETDWGQDKVGAIDTIVISLFSWKARASAGYV